MTDLQNPFRFSMQNTSHNIRELLGHDRVVTEVEIRPQEGNIYIHWDYSELDSDLNKLLKKWQRAECYARENGGVDEADGIGSCATELADILRQRN